MAPSGVWTGRNLAIVVVLLVITNAVTGVAVYFLAVPAAPRVLTVIHPWSGGERDLFLPVLENFTADTGIEVQDRIFRQEELQPVLPIQFDAGIAPADVIFMPSSFILQYGADGHAVDVSDMIDAADYQTGTVAAVTSGNAVYGGVYTGKVKPGFYYSKPFFEANGWDQSPDTFSDFLALLQTIRDDGIQNPIVAASDLWPLSDVTEYFIATYGGAEMHQDLTSGDLSWTDASVQTVFTSYIDPVLPYFDDLVEWTSGVQDIISENNALYFQGFWVPTMFPDDMDPNDWGVMPLPEPVSGAGVVFAIDYLFIPEYTDLLDEAKRLFQFLVGVDGQETQVAQGGHLLTHQNADPSAYPADSAEAAQAATDAAAGRIPLADLDDTVGGEWQQSVFWAELGLYYQGLADAATVLAAIQAGYDDEFGP